MKMLSVIYLIILFPKMVTASNIDDLKSESSVVANTAALNLFKRSIYSIPDLLAIAEERQRFSGDFYRSPIHEGENMEDLMGPSVGVVALYLVEAIIRDDLFFVSTALLQSKNNNGANKEDIQSKAADIYIKWWKKNKDFKDGYTSPLEGSDLKWATGFSKVKIPVKPSDSR